MRYWGAEDSVTRKGRRPEVRKRPRTRSATPALVVSGTGSVAPFLRKFYQHQSGIGLPIQRLFLFLVLAGLIYAFILGDGGAIRIAMLRHERAQLDDRLAELRAGAAQLETEIARLQTDPQYIEKMGRERYGYVRPNDHVYKIVPPKSDD